MMNNLTMVGTPGYQKICPQKCLFVLNKITKKEITPRIIVKAILPVTLADPGMSPKMLLIKIKKRIQSRIVLVD